MQNLGTGTHIEQHFLSDVQLDPAQAWEWVQDGQAVIVDVRCAEERQWFPQVPGAVAIPLHCLKQLFGLDEGTSELSGDSLGPMERRALTARLLRHASAGDALLCFCARGDRSLEAAHLLRELGYERSYAIEGGMHGWEQAGLPLLRPMDIC